ncbi:hypothetical protein ABH15_04820 [Methanoculleus taiwanensis]|uniref:HTH merR-type domain-containing protein n=2 Tax=Methanoculleus taiwanensis TaxID=1550565 RepID=A0A498GYF1_9EURY|nr:hypothetical protein ABH15_04820 [Methanoculleus taiwanensis]
MIIPGRSRQNGKRGRMKEKGLKVDELAQLTGLSIDEIRRLTREYDDLFSYRTIGKVKIFTERAVKTVQELREFAGKGLLPDEIREEIHAGKRPETGGTAEPEELREAVGIQLPPEIVIDLRTMQDALAHQQRQITRLTDHLERERAARETDSAGLLTVIDRMGDRLDRQEQKLAVIAEWVEYFEARVDATDALVSRTLLDRIRGALR